jgi:hypothetical protein
MHVKSLDNVVSSFGLFAGVACALAFAGGDASAHEGDLKLRDRQRPVRGEAWRAVDQGDGGVAGGGFTASGIVLKAWFPLNTFATGVQNGNSCWGWVSPGGREYAIMGLSNGTGFVDITDPGASVIKSFQPGVSSLWRDVRTHSHYCYAASEGGQGIQVFDMSKLDTLGPSRPRAGRAARRTPSRSTTTAASSTVRAVVATGCESTASPTRRIRRSSARGARSTFTRRRSRPTRAVRTRAKRSRSASAA